MNRALVIVVSGVAICAGIAAARALPQGVDTKTVLTGQAAFATAELERPGLFRHITVADLPAPFATESVNNQSHIVARPANAWPQAPAGFQVQLFATGFNMPRELRTAPNGDIFVADSEIGEIKVLRGLTSDGKAQSVTVFASGLHRPFGINFYPPGPNPQYVYVGNTNSVVRFPYSNGDLKARGPAEPIVKSLPSGDRSDPGGGGHWTRDVVFSPDGKSIAYVRRLPSPQRLANQICVVQALE